MTGDNAIEFVPFDAQGHDRNVRRADIIFGPDMCDPRIREGYTPLTDAMREGRSSINPDDLNKTVGEVFGNASPEEIRAAMLENARSIEPS